MKPKDRYQWIIKHLERWGCVDITDRQFSDAYIENCNPRTVKFQPYGAHTVPQLGRDLSEMFKPAF